MKIFIQSFRGGPVAGMGRFHNTLDDELKRCGYTIINPADNIDEGINDADVVMFSADRLSVQTLWKLKQKKIGVVHRLDGRYSQERKYELDKKIRQLNEFADVNVYQSEYCRKVWLEAGLEDGPVIYNGVDISKIDSIPAVSRERGASISAARSKPGFRRLKMIGELAQNAKHPVLFAGRKYDLGESVVWVGDLGFEELISVMKGCTFLFHPAVNDPCPNTVLEAMACGLTVVHSGTGGTAELVGEAGRLIPEDLSNGLADVVPVSWEMIRDRVNRFDISVVAPKYVQAMELACEKAQSSSWVGKPMPRLKYKEPKTRAVFSFTKKRERGKGAIQRKPREKSGEAAVPRESNSIPPLPYLKTGRRRPVRRTRRLRR